MELYESGASFPLGVEFLVSKMEEMAESQDHFKCVVVVWFISWAVVAHISLDSQILAFSTIPGR